jgi:uncharacterized membrane protein (Fun14 family)
MRLLMPLTAIVGTISAVIGAYYTAATYYGLKPNSGGPMGTFVDALGYWPVAMLAVGVVLIVLFLLQAFGVIGGSSKTLERITQRVFDNETVEVDNRNFEDCTFNNVIFRYRGGNFAFARANITGTKGFEASDLWVTGTVNLLNVLDFLEPNFAVSWRSPDKL